jgi:hypothetical protein
MSANNGSFPGAGQGNWWERANYGGQGQAPAAPGGAGGMVTGYPGSTQWFQGQQANYPGTAPGGTDWLRNMQQWQQYIRQQQTAAPGTLGGGLGYGQQGGLAAPQPPGADPLRQQQGGLYGTGGDYLRGGPTALPLGGSQENATPSQPTAGNLGNDALRQGGGAPQGTLPAVDTGSAANQQTTPDAVRWYASTGATGPGPGATWGDFQQGNPDYQAGAGDPLRFGQAPPAPTPGPTDALRSAPPATNTDQTVRIAMQNGRPPTTQTTTAAQLATTQGPATTTPTVPDTGSAAGTQATIGGGPSGAGPVRQINEALVKAYYTNKNPGAFWQQAGQILAGGDRNFEQFFVGNFDRYMAQYLQAAEGNQDLQLSDWLTGPMGEQIRRDYLMQAPEQRGLDYRRTDPGRFDMRY